MTFAGMNYLAVLVAAVAGFAFGGMPAVGHGGRPLQRFLVELLVGRDLQLFGKRAVGSGDHAFT